MISNGVSRARVDARIGSWGLVSRCFWDACVGARAPGGSRGLDVLGGKGGSNMFPMLL